MKITATRFHDFSYGHRVVGHENKCALLHGHNGRVHFTCKAESLDEVGRVIDFSVIKERLCIWLEDNWDHKFLACEQDDALANILRLTIDGEHRARPPGMIHDNSSNLLINSIVWVPFNPTSENMAKFLLEVVGPMQLFGTGVDLIEVRVEETRKCGAAAALE